MLRVSRSERSTARHYRILVGGRQSAVYSPPNDKSNITGNYYYNIRNYGYTVGIIRFGRGQGLRWTSVVKLPTGYRTGPTWADKFAIDLITLD